MDGDPRGQLDSATELGCSPPPRTRICMCSPARRVDVTCVQMYNRTILMLVEPDGQVAVCKIV